MTPFPPPVWSLLWPGDQSILTPIPDLSAIGDTAFPQRRGQKEELREGKRLLFSHQQALSCLQASGSCSPPIPSFSSPPAIFLKHRPSSSPGPAPLPGPSPSLKQPSLTERHLLDRHLAGRAHLPREARTLPPRFPGHSPPSAPSPPRAAFPGCTEVLPTHTLFLYHHSLLPAPFPLPSLTSCFFLHLGPDLKG